MSFITLLLVIARIISACLAAENANAANLTVSTRTGTFVGDLNDTYPDVRQFKWIPYAKVSLILSSGALSF
jgi:hypothetical protein